MEVGTARLSFVQKLFIKVKEKYFLQFVLIERIDHQGKCFCVYMQLLTAWTYE